MECLFSSRVRMATVLADRLPSAACSRRRQALLKGLQRRRGGKSAFSGTCRPTRRREEAKEGRPNLSNIRAPTHGLFGRLASNVSNRLLRPPYSLACGGSPLLSTGSTMGSLISFPAFPEDPATINFISPEPQIMKFMGLRPRIMKCMGLGPKIKEKF